MSKSIRIVHVNEEPYDIYIGRPSIWQNTNVVGVHGTRKECIQKYERDVRSNPKLMSLIPTLEGKTLGCWCKRKSNPLPCHGDVLVKIYNEQKHGLLRFKK